MKENYYQQFFSNLLIRGPLHKKLRSYFLDYSKMRFSLNTSQPHLHCHTHTHTQAKIFMLLVATRQSSVLDELLDSQSYMQR